MNLLNRYLQEVGRYLPKSRREDIIAELRANLASQIDDREQELGRPLTDGEMVAMLKHHGNPAVVAGRYRERNHGLAFGVQLIGPELFPIYRTILLLNMSITLIILAVVVPLVAQSLHEPVTLSRILTPLVAQFAAVTLIFIALDRGKDHVLNSWDPGRLPPVKSSPEDRPTARNIFDFIALAVGTVWMALTPHWPYLLLGPGAYYLQKIPVQPMPQWIAFYWAIILLLGLQLTLQFLGLFRWPARRQARIADLALKIAGMAIGMLLLFRFPNFVISPYKEVADWANLTLLVSVIVALAIQGWETVKLLRSLAHNRAGGQRGISNVIPSH